MLDIKFVRENPEKVKENIKKKFQDKKLVLVDEVINLDSEYREIKVNADNYRKERNEISDKIGTLMREGKKEEGLSLKEKVVNISLNDIDDFPKENIIQYFTECIEFIESANKTYVHCMCGISRSSTIVIAYLMWKTHATYNEAQFFVKNRRRYISPNEGFVQQLKIFEKLLKENDYDLNKIDFGKIKWPQ